MTEENGKNICKPGDEITFNFEFDYFDDDQKKHSYQEDDEFVEDGFEIESDSG